MRVLLGAMWKIVHEHMVANGKWDGKFKLGCGYNDLFLSDGVYGHVLVSAQKNRFQDVSAKPGPPSSLALVGVDGDQFNGLIAAAIRTTKEREVDRM